MDFSIIHAYSHSFISPPPQLSIQSSPLRSECPLGLGVPRRNALWWPDFARDLPVFALVTRMQYTQFFQCLLCPDSCHTSPKDSVGRTCVEDRLSQHKEGAIAEKEESTPGCLWRLWSLSLSSLPCLPCKCALQESSKLEGWSCFRKWRVWSLLSHLPSPL